MEKGHFVPIRYRVIGGILQGLNIKFGNFIEALLSNLFEIDPGVEPMPDSGKRIKLFFTAETDALVDNYITGRQLANSPDDCTPMFDRFLQTRYADVDRYLSEIGDDPEILCVFDEMYQSIRYAEIPSVAGGQPREQ